MAVEQQKKTSCWNKLINKTAITLNTELDGEKHVAVYLPYKYSICIRRMHKEMMVVETMR